MVTKPITKHTLLEHILCEVCLHACAMLIKAVTKDKVLTYSAVLMCIKLHDNKRIINSHERFQKRFVLVTQGLNTKHNHRASVCFSQACSLIMKLEDREAL